MARAAVEEGSKPSDALLSEYAVTPSMGQPLRTPRTPAEQDTILTVSFVSSIVVITMNTTRKLNVQLKYGLDGVLFIPHDHV